MNPSDHMIQLPLLSFFFSLPYLIHLFEYPSRIAHKHIGLSEGMGMCHLSNESQDQFLPPLLIQQQLGCSVKEFVPFDHLSLCF
jgi:hypothetical protein